MKSTFVAFLLWCGGFLLLNGLHRLYVGKIGTGLLWLFTCGLCGIGQFIDLFTLGSMVRQHNTDVELKQMRAMSQTTMVAATAAATAASANAARGRGE